MVIRMSISSAASSLKSAMGSVAGVAAASRRSARPRIGSPCRWPPDMELPPSFLLPSRPHLLLRGTRTHASSRSISITRSTHFPHATGSAVDLSYPSHIARPTPYEIFHFTSRNVTPAQVKARYYDLVRTCHPDRHTKPKPQAEEEFKSIVAAYNLLKEPNAKQMYDRAGIGWGATSPPLNPHRDLRYRRRPPAGGHDQFGWQNPSFYSSHFHPTSPSSAGWRGGNGKYTSNGIFISTIFILTWFLAGLQYSRLSLQSQKAIQRADRQHLDAAKSLNDARHMARSKEGQQRWRAFRRRAREQRWVEQLQRAEREVEEPEERQEQGLYGVGHGGPSGKQAAIERFAQAQALSQSQPDNTV